MTTDHIEFTRRDAAHLIHPVTSPKDLANGDLRVIVEGDGLFIKDDKGNTLIDGFAGLWCVAVGHGRKEIADAIAEQLATLEYGTTFHGQSHPKAIELAEKLSQMFDPSYGLNHVMFSSGGSEANETNFKMVRLYWALKGENRRKTIVARNHGYHGLTIATMTATGIMPMRWNFGPDASGFDHIPAPYCYRCDLNKTFPSCGLACADALEEYVIAQGVDSVGAFIAEPVIGAGGIIPPPPGYFTRIREICDKYGILLILDEVVTGFGRTGTMFGAQQFEVRPDIVTLAKGITSGYQPLGASVISDEIWDTISTKLADRMPVSHGFTYSGHPVCCAAALANIGIIEKEGLAENARVVGDHLMARLKELESFDSVGEVRGLGLMAGIELVADKESKRGFQDPHRACERVEHEAWERGLYCRAMGVEVVGLAPPLTMDTETVDRMVDILGDSIEAMEADILVRDRSRPKREIGTVANAAEYFGITLPEKFNAVDAGDLELAVAFDLSGEGGGIWVMAASGGTVSIKKVEVAGEVAAVIKATAKDYIDIINGVLSGTDAFVSQQLVVEGDMNASAALMKLGAT